MGADRSVRLALDGFSGPLQQLLELARAHQVDLARLPILDLVDQLAAAVQRPEPQAALGERGDWVVMAAWLLLLRSQMLLPVGAAAQGTAMAAADGLRDRMLALGETQALAAWLDGRPQLGLDVFARGRAEALGAVAPGAVDVIEFLWASLALFDDDLPRPDVAPVYRPAWLDLHTIPDARERIRRVLAGLPQGGVLAQFLPGDGSARPSPLRRRSAWTSVFAASLEMAKQGEVGLAQDGAFAPIHVQAVPGGGSPAAR